MEDIEVIRRGNNDVTFSLKDGSGSVLVKGWYSGSQYSLDEVEFSDGTVWGQEDVEFMSKNEQGCRPGIH